MSEFVSRYKWVYILTIFICLQSAMAVLTSLPFLTCACLIDLTSGELIFFDQCKFLN